MKPIMARVGRQLASVIDCDAVARTYAEQDRTGVHWPRVIPFIVLHAGCLGVIWVGWSPVAMLVALVLFFARVFFVTAFYHRYFSHRTFRTSRPWQFVFALLGNSAVQRGPLWWAAHHRNHHAVADRDADPHSPHTHSLYWSHMGWITARENFATKLGRVADLARFRELRLLDRFDTVVPLLLAVALFVLGELLRVLLPVWGTNGWQMLVWGFFISTVALFHVTCLVNSAAHRLGRKTFPTGDESRNSFWLALITFGEGWHNNHHYYPASARQGFYRWQIDITYYLLRVLAFLRIIHGLRPVPQRVLVAGRARR